ncbi:hypothetical protein MTO96_009200 [Rhipicephalus appendiculatus]
MDELGVVALNLVNRPLRPRSQARAATRPPDLSIWSNAGTIAWSYSFADLGSDHRVLCVTVGEYESEVDVCRKARVVDCDTFRENSERRSRRARSRISKNGTGDYSRT